MITRTTTTYREVSMKAVYRWVDAHGRKRQKTEKFFQTLNPFNKNADGSIKNSREILAELKPKYDQWLKDMAVKFPTHKKKA